ncbi:MAG: sigma-70 family RNA polymerase sigma factor [Bifidobacteriaceae bacterium]|jgi:RNA polymerase sigma factor (sigma-70 family)|nr:sigma-70 family RNA polymerase sigma factor [Bifidobacteriaceae bacterium]
MAAHRPGGTPSPATPDPSGLVCPPITDAELIAAVRGGDRAAFAELYTRHAPAATAVARRLVSRPADAEDIVAETFARVFRLLGQGKGPDSFFRAYVFTAVRHLAVSFGQASNRVDLSDDETVFDDALGAGQNDPGEWIGDRQIVREAFASLPERWRTALWYAEVEGLATSQMAPILGLTSNGVAALLYRAREGLRQAYLGQHLARPSVEACRTVAGRLGAYARGALGERERGRVAGHLATCGRCRTVAAEISDINKGLRGVIAPLVLGGGAGLADLLNAIGGLPPIPSTGPALALSGGGPAPPASAPEVAAPDVGVGAPSVPAQSLQVCGPEVAGADLAGGARPGPGTAGARAAKGGASGGVAIAGVAVAAIVAGVAVLGQRAPDPPPAHTPAAAQSEASTLGPETVPPDATDGADTMALVFTRDGPLGIELVGAPLPSCQGEDAPAKCAASSAAALALPDRAEVLYATLAWAASDPSEPLGEATLVAPDGKRHAVAPAKRDVLLAGLQATAEVTEAVATGGGGIWTVTGATVGSGKTAFAGWSLTVVYAAPDLPKRRASVYQGALRVEAGTGKELEVEAPAGTASHVGFVAWGADAARSGSDIWMSSGTGRGAVSQELIANPFRGRAAGYAGERLPGTDVVAVNHGVVFPRADGAANTVALRLRAWGDSDQSDPFTLGAVSLVADLLPESAPALPPTAGPGPGRATASRSRPVAFDGLDIADQLPGAGLEAVVRCHFGGDAGHCVIVGECL